MRWVEPSENPGAAGAAKRSMSDVHISGTSLTTLKAKTICGQRSELADLERLLLDEPTAGEEISSMRATLAEMADAVK